MPSAVHITYKARHKLRTLYDSRGAVHDDAFKKVPALKKEPVKAKCNSRTNHHDGRKSAFSRSILNADPLQILCKLSN